MKTMRRAKGPAAVIIFLIGLLLIAAPGHSAPDGEAPGTPAASITDGSMFARELHAAGALKFYESTEDFLRTGQFERALVRYAFLKGQIARQPGYRSLVTMINQRLHFLQGQLRLPAQELAALPAPRIQRPPPEKKAPAPADPPASSTSKVQPDPDGIEAKSNPAGPPPKPNLAAAPQPQASQEKPEEAKAEVEKLPPTPSTRWQRIKKRLLFWRK